MLDVYEKLGVEVPNLAQFDQIFSESKDYEECLVNIYQDIQRFHHASYKLFSLRQKCECRRLTCADLNADDHS